MRIFPTQVRILEGRREKNRTAAKNRREKKSQKQRSLTFRQPGRHPHLERHGGRSRNGKQRSDGQIQRAGKEIGKAPADEAAHMKQIPAFRDAHGGYPQQRKPYAGNAEADGRRKHPASGLLSHTHRKNQVPCSEEQPKQHRSNNNILFHCQFRLIHFRRSLPYPQINA